MSAVDRHLTDEQLGAIRDGAASAMSAADSESAQRHLAGCAECRTRLAGLESLDHALARALEHDPGEAYFASFADRVASRITAGGSRVAKSERRGLASWWSSPRSLAWAGGALGLIAVAALVLTLAQQHGPQELASRVNPPAVVGGGSPPRGSASRAAAPPAASSLDEERRAGTREPSLEAKDKAAARRTSPEARNEAGLPAPSTDAAPSPTARGVLQLAPPPLARAPQQAMTKQADRLAERDLAGAPPPAAARQEASAQRVVEVRTLPNGEQVPVNREQKSAPAPAPPIRLPSGLFKPSAAPLAGQTGATQSLADGGAAAKPAQSQPGAAVPEAAPPQARLKDYAYAPGENGASRVLCGTVNDSHGRPAAGAMVTLVESGASVSAGADGSWCIAMPAGGGTLSVLAVGYRPFRVRVPASFAQQPYVVTLSAVDALAGSAAFPMFGRGDSTGFGGRLARKPVGGAGLARRAAIDASAFAERAKSATAWTRAADLWETAALVESGDAALDADFRGAESRVNAWLLERTEERRLAAQKAVSSFLDLAPAGQPRDIAVGWSRALAR